MTEETYETVDASEKKGNSTLWIILGIVAVVLFCCCCIVILSAMIIGMANFTTDTYRYFSPLLSMI